MKSRLITLLLPLTVAGCLTIPTSTEPITMQSGKPVPAERIYRRELTVPSPGHTAKVSFLRDAGFLGGACTHKILVDGKAVFGIRAGEYQTLYLAPGQHLFALEIEGGTCPAFSTSHQTALSDGEEETYRIHIPSISTEKSTLRVEIIDAKTGGSRGSWTSMQGPIPTKITLVNPKTEKTAVCPDGLFESQMMSSDQAAQQRAWHTEFQRTNNRLPTPMEGCLKLYEILGFVRTPQ